MNSISDRMSSKIEFDNLVENEVFDDEAAFPPAPPVQRPAAFTSPVPQQPPLPLPSAEGTPLRDTRLKLAHRTEGLRTIVLAFAVFSFGLTVALAIELFTGSPPLAPHAGVTSSSEICSNIGIDQLKKGGNAVDAAISTMLCIGVVRPQSAGLGGGGFLIMHDHKTHNTTLLDFRETAPKGLSAVTSQDALKKGGKSVGVPGELAGMAKAHALFGQLPWTDLFTPVIKLAEDGWIMDKKDEMDLKRRWNDLQEPSKYTLFRQTFLVGESLSPRMKRPKLASVLRNLSKDRDHAVKLFYTGFVANEIIDTLTQNDGVMSKDDLKDYKVEIREPLSAMFHDFNIITFPAPSSGSLLIYMLNELEELKKDDTLDSVNYYVKLAEVTSKAYKCRALLGDPDEALVTMHEKILANDNKTVDIYSYCDAVKNQIPAEDRGTSHVNVIDNDEMMVAVTTSLNYWYGSMLMTPSGILLNNQMDDFDLTPDPNHAAPKLRPLSSMVPTIMYHNTRPCLQRIAIGGTNGTRIPSSVAQTLVNLLVKSDNVETAVESPKIFCTTNDCQLENFTNAREVAQAITDRNKLPVIIVDEKLATIGALVKLNLTVDGYIGKSSYGKAAVY